MGAAWGETRSRIRRARPRRSSQCGTCRRHDGTCFQNSQEVSCSTVSIARVALSNFRFKSEPQIHTFEYMYIGVPVYGRPVCLSARALHLSWTNFNRTQQALAQFCRQIYGQELKEPRPIRREAPRSIKHWKLQDFVPVEIIDFDAFPVLTSIFGCKLRENIVFCTRLICFAVTLGVGRELLHEAIFAFLLQRAAEDYPELMLAITLLPTRGTKPLHKTLG